MLTDYTPKEITKDIDTGIEIASFSYYDGINYCKEAGLHHTTDFQKVNHGTHYIVCCGDVMIRTDKEMWSNIERKILI